MGVGVVSSILTTILFLLLKVIAGLTRYNQERNTGQLMINLVKKLFRIGKYKPRPDITKNETAVQTVMSDQAFKDWQELNESSKNCKHG